MYCRYAKAHNIDFSVPRAHPFMPLFPLRLSLLSTCGGDSSLQERIIDAIYTALWGDASGFGILPTEDEFTKVAASCLGSGAPSIDQLVERAKSEAAKADLKQSGDDAIKAGIFGVPTMLVEHAGRSDIFWGNDQVDYIEMIASGKGKIIEVTPEYEEALRRIPVAAVRPQPKPKL